MVSPDLPGRHRALERKSAGRGKSARKAESDAALARIRPALEARADGRCEVTGLPFTGPAHAHHRKRRGGPELDVLSNLLLVAPQSHLAAYDGSIHAEPARSRMFGWILRSHQDPASTPVLYRGERVLLADDGAVTPTEGLPE